MAALRNGIGTVLIPRDNLRDLEEIDQTVRAALRFVPVSTVDEVFAAAMCPEKPVPREEPAGPLTMFTALPHDAGEGPVLRQ